MYWSQLVQPLEGTAPCLWQGKKTGICTSKGHNCISDVHYLIFEVVSLNLVALLIKKLIKYCQWQHSKQNHKTWSTIISILFQSLHLAFWVKVINSLTSFSWPPSSLILYCGWLVTSLFIYCYSHCPVWNNFKKEKQRSACFKKKVKVFSPHLLQSSHKYQRPICQAMSLSSAQTLSLCSVLTSRRAFAAQTLWSFSTQQTKETKLSGTK